MFGGSYQIMAAQEISNNESAEFLRTLLPGGPSVWDSAFTDTTDSMDNSFWYKSSAFLRDSFLLLTTDRRDSSRQSDNGRGARIAPATGRAVRDR